MDKLVPFSEWLQVRDPEFYNEGFMHKYQKAIGGAALGLGALGAYMGFGGSGSEAPKTPPTPAAHVRSIGDDIKSPMKSPMSRTSTMQNQYQGKMPAEPPAIPKTQAAPAKWNVKDELNLARALREAGIRMHNLRTSGVPHGTTIDVDGDGSPDNPQENYFNTGDRTYYGKGGKAQWTFDGHEIHSVR